MKRIDFVESLSEHCEFENTGFTPDTILKDIEEYDSLAVMSIIAFVDEHFKKSLTAGQLSQLTDFNSLMDLIGKEHFAE